ncbi:hypothetical protein J6590_040978 [Homalodisca vitripennis]|nr:hypothetical protein J6590_040978 [Homalodisca vitripennis]
MVFGMFKFSSNSRSVKQLSALIANRTCAMFSEERAVTVVTTEALFRNEVSERLALELSQRCISRFSGVVYNNQVQSVQQSPVLSSNDEDDNMDDVEYQTDSEVEDSDYETNARQ